MRKRGSVDGLSARNRARVEFSGLKRGRSNGESSADGQDGKEPGGLEAALSI